MIEKTLNNKNTTKQKQTNNGFRDTKKHRAKSSLNEPCQLEAFIFNDLMLPVCFAKCLYSHKEDFPENLDKSTA